MDFGIIIALASIIGVSSAAALAVVPFLEGSGIIGGRR